MNIQSIPHTPLKSILAAATASVALTATAQTVIYDWQFDEPAGTPVFAEVTNNGTGPASFGDWQSYTTDGNGNWQVGDSVGQDNKFSSIFLFPGEGVSTNGVWTVDIAIPAWEFENSAEDKSQLIFGFIDSADTKYQAKFTSNANGIKLIDDRTMVAFFRPGSESSTNFTSDGDPLDANGDPLEGAPVLQGGDTMLLRYVADLDAGTYTYSYAINDGDYYELATGPYTGTDIQKFRLATQQFEAEDLIFVDYMMVSGTGDIPQPVTSPWDGVYPLIGESFRDTGIGLLYDLEFPYVYHFTAGSWLYVDPDLSAIDGLYAYDFAGQFWFWTSDGLGGWHFNLQDPAYGESGWGAW